MTKIRQRKYLLAVAALVLVFAGCKGESPTAPTSTPGGQGGGVTPPTGATVAVSVSNANPLVDSTTTVTATVTQNNQPVANGTAVQFTTAPIGTFTEANANTVIRTTTNGVATATLTSSTAGNATVTATVNNVSAKTTVTFSTKSVTPPPPNTTPTITSISPTTGKPAGGDIITIVGTNFAAPVRVVFDYGNGLTKEAQVVSVSATQIQVISPPVDLGSGQTASATINVIINAGTPNEQKVSASSPFVYQAAVLTPKVYSLSPTSGPIDGGTRITIVGEGFQAPVQVFFGAQDAQILNVTFSQITVISPTARDTAPDGSGAVTGPVDVKVVNINSNTSVIATGAFRYTPKVQITAAGPTEGMYTGGTRVTIDGVGFNDPVAVVIGGVAAQPIKVSGTQIIAITSAVNVSACGDVKGPITVTNVDNGDTASGPDFTYRVPKPIITNVASAGPITPGSTIQVTVLNPGAIPRLTIGTSSVPITGSTANPDGTVTFTTVVPTNYQLSTQSCTGGVGTIQVATSADVTYTSGQTSCADTLRNGITVNPIAAPILSMSPLSFAPFSATIIPGTAGPPATPTTVTPSAAQTVTLANTGSVPLTIQSVAQTGTGCARFTIINAPPPQVLNSCDQYPIIARYNGQTVAAADQCTITITTDAGTRSLSLIGTSQ